MFGVDFSEILLILGIALVVLGPEKLPKLASTIGKWIGRARAMARQFREQLEQESQTLHKSVDLRQELDFSSRPGAQPGSGGAVPRPTADSSTAQTGAGAQAQPGPQPRIDPRPMGPPSPTTGPPLSEMGLADTYPAAFYPYQPPPIAEPLPAAAPTSAFSAPATAPSPAPSTPGAASTAANGSASAAGAAAGPAGATGEAGAPDPSFPDPHQTSFWPPDGVL